MLQSTNGLQLHLPKRDHQDQAHWLQHYNRSLLIAAGLVLVNKLVLMYANVWLLVNFIIMSILLSIDFLYMQMYMAE